MIKDLFDFNFDKLITRKILGVVYAILVVLISLGSVAALFVGFNMFRYEELAQLLVLIGVPVTWFLSLVLIRVGFETSIALILIAENTKK
jgi:hypothetical protein